ncbi:dihydrodipicolinate synthase family protein [Buttiauxella sp. A2-C2_NF]|jgi:dihydrodipicolinate synthase/N-acetylneuraminate lyase|uniref:dihydrodipicolinate synthase family protein n=1 Tax=Buttiauxella ferragutiae TaxID=82989 RepID=UPI001E36B01B|nr:dihydrodipicolinate synthase family protein [Buttiauxella ferragutiae]MCE0827144.1 dihydrodipicolinate synthase family protein [Buttiauxella ferragutiae]
MFKPHGVCSAMYTPMNADYTINEAVVRKMVDFQIEKGLDGIFPVSTAGEFIHLSLDQCEQLMTIVVNQVNGRVPVVPGVTASCAHHAIRLAKKARSLGCQAVVSCTPFFFTQTEDETIKYFLDIAETADIPIIIYNIPMFTKPLSLAVTTKLIEHPMVLGIKDSSGSMVDMMHIIDHIRTNNLGSVYMSGREDFFDSALIHGASGCYTSCAGIFPEIMTAIYDSVKNNEFHKAQQIQCSLLPLLRMCFSLPFPIGFKIALETRGFEMGPYWSSLDEVTINKISSIKSLIELETKKLVAFGETLKKHYS